MRNVELKIKVCKLNFFESTSKQLIINAYIGRTSANRKSSQNLKEWVRIEELKFWKIHLRIAIMEIDLDAIPLGFASSSLHEMIEMKKDMNPKSSSSQTEVELEARFQWNPQGIL